MNHWTKGWYFGFVTLLASSDRATIGPRVSTSPLAPVLAYLVLLVAGALLWFSPFDHPLYPHDEGRYAAVAAHMVDSGDWLVPVFRGEPHLTKPPLTYWLEGLAVLGFGRAEISARLPAMLASTGVLITLFLFLRRQRGVAAAALAVGLYSIMPLAVVVGRIGATDAILNLWWTLSLVAAYLAIETNLARWRLLLWISVALAALTKGPLAVGPVGVVVVWLALAGRIGDARRLGLLWLPIAFVPVSLWVLALQRAGHDVLSVWWLESAGRANGALGKHEPWWFYLPIFLLGFFPATAMMTLPWFNLSPAAAWARLRNGSLESLLVCAVVVPLIVFSAASGKLPTYLLPVAMPIAVLTSANVLAWCDGRYDRAVEGFRPPDVRVTLAACSVLAAIAIPIAAALAKEPFRDFWPNGLAFALPAAAALVAALCWSKRSNRAPAVTATWLSFALVWVWAFHEEDRLWEPRSPAIVMNAVVEEAGPSAKVVVVGEFDQTRHFYFAGEIRELGTRPDWGAAKDAIDLADIAIVDSSLWPTLVTSVPELQDRLQRIRVLPAFLGGTVTLARVLKPQVHASARQ